VVRRFNAGGEGTGYVHRVASFAPEAYRQSCLNG
jgi:hypothetical protein